MEIVTLSTSRNILKDGTSDRERMRRYAEHAPLHIVVLTQKKHGYGGEIVHEGNLHLYPTHSVTRIGMAVTGAVLLSRILARTKHLPRIVSTQDPLELGFLGYLVSTWYRVPLNVQVHGDYFSPFWLQGSFVNQFRRHLLAFVCARAASIRVVSERIKKSLIIRGIPERKIEVLPIRPEIEKFLSAENTRSAKDNRLVILSASRFTEEKNIPRLIAAFADMAKRCPNAVLRLVGKGPLESLLRTCAARHGVEEKVTFVPWTEHIETEMANADVFALASYHEAYGLVLIEALASGTPVVTTNVGCVGEVIQDHVHGIVVTESGIKPYAAALIRMCEEHSFRSEAGRAGRELGKKLSSVSYTDYAKAWVAAHTRI